eukprot:528911-Alexandrium_andersonii.AAC.1
MSLGRSVDFGDGASTASMPEDLVADNVDVGACGHWLSELCVEAVGSNRQVVFWGPYVVSTAWVNRWFVVPHAAAWVARLAGWP